MAKLTTSIKTATKLTGMNPIIDGQTYKFYYKNAVISFNQNGKSDEAVAFYVQKRGNVDNLVEDRFNGFFKNNLSQCFDLVNRMESLQ